MRPAGLPIVSIACVAVGLIDFNPSVQRFHLERVKKYLDLAYEYEAKNVLLVLGEYIWNQEVIPPAEQWRVGVENCRRLGDYAAELGVQIALELEPFQAVARQLGRFDGPLPRRLQSSGRAGQHRHFASATWRASQPEELRRLKGKAIHVHISDCDGKKHGDLPPGRGVVPLRAVPPRDQSTSASTARSRSSSNTRPSPQESSSGSPRRTRRPTA